MADKCGQKECCGFFIMFLVLAAVLVLTISVFHNASQEENSPVNVDENPSVNPGVYVGLAVLGVFVFMAVVCLCVLLFKQGKEVLPTCKSSCFQFLEEKIKQGLKPREYSTKNTDNTDTVNQSLTRQPVNTDHKLNDASKEFCIVNLDPKCTKTKDGNK